MSLVAVGLDAAVTRSRMLAYGPSVELNPVAKWFGPKYGPAFVGASNLLWVLILAPYQIPLALFTGFKLSLAYLQLLGLGHTYVSQNL